MTGIWLVSYVVLWLVVLALVVMVLSLARLVGRLHQRIGPVGAFVTDQGPEVGETFADSLAGIVSTDPDLAFPREKDLLLVFVAPDCRTCADLLRDLRPFAVRLRGRLDVRLVSTVSDLEDNAEFATRARRSGLTFQAHPRLAEALAIRSTPYGIWIDERGTVSAKGLLNHTEHLESLLNARQSGFASHEDYLTSLEPADSSPSPGDTGPAARGNPLSVLERNQSPAFGEGE
jgi:methylamine dehydrogenase accessory protein MauD